MIKELLLVLLLLVCPLTWARQDSQALIENLKSRLFDLSSHRGTLIKSYTHLSQSYIYDQALAVIAFSREKDKKSARALLKAMKSLQMKDGSLYFSYYLDGTSPYPIGGEGRIAGAMAWVSLAASHYQYQFKSDEFVSFNRSLLSYLDTQMKDISLGNTKMRAVRFSPQRDIVALEHNLDTFVAIKHFQKLNKTEEWNSSVLDLKNFITSMWDKNGSHFWSGASLGSNKINKSELYLDNQSWTVLALNEDLLTSYPIEEVMKFNCENFYVKHEGTEGFQDSRPVRRPASMEFVWSEGTLGQVLAMKKTQKILGKKIHCEKNATEDFISSIKNMEKEDGGIAYATKTSHKDFSNFSSVAGTAWMYFAVNEFNPFQINGTL